VREAHRSLQGSASVTLQRLSFEETDMGQRRGRSFDLLIAIGKLPFRMAASALLLLTSRRPEAVLNRLGQGDVAIEGLGWRDFEKLVGLGFQQRGFTVLDRKGLAESEVPLLLTRGAERFLVQCRDWRAQQVSGRAVRDLHAAVAAQRLAGGFVITSGTFTTDARKLAAARNIGLIDGKHLDALLKDGRRRVADVIFNGIAANGPEMTPYCPACRTPMIVRTTKRGGTAGSFFWGCPQFPTCRQTMVMWSEGRRSA